MSARRPSDPWPVPAFSTPTTPVFAMPVCTSSNPNWCSFAATKAEVRRSSKPSSGCACRSRRQAVMSSWKSPIRLMIAMAAARVVSIEPAVLAPYLTSIGPTDRNQNRGGTRQMSASLLSQSARCAIAGLVALGWSAAPATAQDVKIGAIMSTTGPLQVFGEAGLRGIQLAIDQVNEAGGVLGQQVELVAADDATNPQVGVDAAQRIVNVDGVAGIIGALSSGVTIPIASTVSATAGVPQISTASTSPVISTLDDNGFLFRTTPHDALQGEVLADVVSQQGVDKVAVVYVNNDYGKGLADAFAESYEGEVSASVAYEERQASYRGELSRAAEGDPEALVMIAYPGDGIPMIRQALEEGFFEGFVFTDGMKAAEVAAAAGDALDEVANPPGETILPGEFAKARDLLAAGEDVNYEGAAGSQHFDEVGDVPGTYSHWAIEGGQIVEVELITPGAS